MPNDRSFACNKYYNLIRMLRSAMKRSGLRENIKLCVLGGYVQGFEDTGTLFQ